MIATGSEDLRAYINGHIDDFGVAEVAKYEVLVQRVSLQESEIAQGKPLPPCLFRTQSQTPNLKCKGQVTQSQSII
jgi:hypothetical protein